MRILVKASTQAKKEKVERLDQPLLPFGGAKEILPTYRVAVSAAPERGKANRAIQEALAVYFSVPLSTVLLVQGATSKQKVFDIQSK